MAQTLLQEIYRYTSVLFNLKATATSSAPLLVTTLPSAFNKIISPSESQIAFIPSSVILLYDINNFCKVSFFLRQLLMAIAQRLDILLCETSSSTILASSNCKVMIQSSFSPVSPSILNNKSKQGITNSAITNNLASHPQWSYVVMI